VKRIRRDEAGHYALEIVKRTRESYLSLGVAAWRQALLSRRRRPWPFLDAAASALRKIFKPLAVPSSPTAVVVNGQYASTMKKSEQADQVLKEIVENVAVPV